MESINNYEITNTIKWDSLQCEKYYISQHIQLKLNNEAVLTSVQGIKIQQLVQVWPHSNKTSKRYKKTLQKKKVGG